MDEITILQAETLRALASPRRLQILHALAAGPLEVGRLATLIGTSQPNASQHLAALRTVGIVEAERDGREVRYRLVDPEVMVACQIMRGVLERRLQRMALIASDAAVSAPTLATTSPTARRLPLLTPATPR